jgi:large subunit ribosomal protein L10
MSKPIKSMLMREYASRIAGADDAMLISIRGMKATATNKLRLGLAKKNIKVTVVRNALAKKTFEGTGLEKLGGLLTGASAVASGGNSVVEVAREIVGLMKTFPGLELKGAVLDGQLFEGDAGVKELSKFPTREEGIAKAVTLIISPGQTLVGAIKGPASTLMGVLKAIETKLEKGEAIAKAG